MSDIMLPDVGQGLQKTDGIITLNFDPMTKVIKREDGVYIAQDSFGNGQTAVIDDWTIKSIGTTPDGHMMIDVNYDVVVCIYTMSRRKVTSRRTVQTYSTSNETKTVDDVLNEFNCVMDAYRALGQAVPEGLARTSYILKPGDCFQLRENARPFVQPPNANGETWLCAMDDANRYQEDAIRAFFYVTAVEYNDSIMPKYYMTKLSIRCVWSELPEFIAGQTYTSAK